MAPFDHRKEVGQGEKWDLLGALQFSILFQEGLREHHSLLDIGCGPLRAGRFFILYLNEGGYIGVDPSLDSVVNGSEAELGNQLIEKKSPKFRFNSTFDFGEGPFDYLLCHSVIGHLPISGIRKLLKSASKVMHPTSKFLFTFLPGRDSEIEKWVYPEHVTYNPDTLAFIAGECGLEMQILGHQIAEATHTWAMLRKQSP